MKPHSLLRIPALRAALVALLALAPLMWVSTAEASPAAPAGRQAAQPLERAHAHNDYEHARPLADALDHGFTSVEADVWLVDGELYLGHDRPDLTRTLRATYLDPMQRRWREFGGSLYPRWDGAVRLLIDVKSEGTAAWPVIERQLAQYPELVTSYRGGRVNQGSVTAVISGNRDLPAMRAATTRFSFYDGRLTDLESGMPASLMPLVSDNWTRHFTWTGVGPMPEAERAKLRQLVAAAHAHGYQLRFWATPDTPTPNREALWAELVAADVDILNTDDLAGLQTFLLARDPQERAA